MVENSQEIAQSPFLSGQESHESFLSYQERTFAENNFFLGGGLTYLSRDFPYTTGPIPLYRPRYGGMHWDRMLEFEFQAHISPHL